MLTGLRRILATAFIGILAGIGVIAARRGLRPRARIAPSAEELVPVAGPASAPRLSAPSRRVPRKARRRGPVLALIALLLLGGSAGVIYASRDVLFGHDAPATGGEAQPLAALSVPDAGGSRSPAPGGDLPAGSLRSSEPDGEAASPFAPAPVAPSFDVVRVAPDGETVVAGRAAPNADVELLLDGRPVARGQTDAGGHFTLTPPALPTGSSALGLRATEAGGTERHAPETVAVVVAPSRDAPPLVALTAPDKPTQILSQSGPKPATDSEGRAGERARQTLRGSGEREAAPDSPASGMAPPVTRNAERGPAPDAAETRRQAEAGGRDRPAEAGRQDGAARPYAAPSAPPKVVSIDAQDGGRLFVTARGAAGDSLRLYLNGTLIAPATVGRDGTVTFTIGRGVKPGAYTVRLDRVDPTTGKVRDRAEVPFTAPGPGHTEGVEYAAGGSDEARPFASAPATRGRSGEAQSPPASTGSLAASPPPGTEAGSSRVTVPGIETARIERGDNLWTISRRTYGEGVRYTLIFDANQDQIRDPDLIYPGQVLVLPSEATPD
jgi:nucleoid-associated protein YgaU